MGNVAHAAVAERLQRGVLGNDIQAAPFFPHGAVEVNEHRSVVELVFREVELGLWAHTVPARHSTAWWAEDELRGRRVADDKVEVGRALGRCAKRVLVGSWPFETRVRNLQADTQGGQPRASLDQRKQAPRSIPSHRPKSCSCRWSGRWHSARGARDATSATGPGSRRTGWRSSPLRSRTAASRVPWCAPCCQYTTHRIAPRR